MLELTRIQSSPSATKALTAAHARHYVAARCDGLPADALDVVRLLTTELVTNALCHGGGDVRLDIQLEAHQVTVGVTDRGRGEVRVPPQEGWPEGRHGLRVVSALADRWGVEPTADMPGKRVWFELTWNAPGRPARVSPSWRRPEMSARQYRRPTPSSTLPYLTR